MQTTENYNLNVAELEDVADITKVSANFPTIDEALGNHDAALDKLKNKGNATTPIYIDANGNAKVTKNFNDYLLLAGGVLTGEIKNKINTYYRGGNPPASSVGVFGTQVIDGNNIRISGVYNEVSNSSTITSGVYAYNPSSTDFSNAHISVSYLADGSVVTYAPTPLATDSTTKIATTAYVKANVPASIGSSTKPVYTNANGVITACTYSLNANVPSNAKFTDTVTTIGATGNSTQPVYFSAKNTASACTMANATTGTGLAKIVASNTNANRTTTGSYVQINGVQIEWGTGTTTNKAASITFTRAFTGVPAVCITPKAKGDGGFCAPSVTTSGFTVEYDRDIADSEFNWIAIGYHS